MLQLPYNINAAISTQKEHMHNSEKKLVVGFSAIVGGWVFTTAACIMFLSLHQKNKL